MDLGALLDSSSTNNTCKFVTFPLCTVLNLFNLFSFCFETSKVLLIVKCQKVHVVWTVIGNTYKLLAVKES